MNKIVKLLCALLFVAALNSSVYAAIFSNIPSDVEKSIELEAAKKPFASDAGFKKRWIDEQREAYLKTEKIKQVKDLSGEVIFEIYNDSIKKHSGDWKNIANYMQEEVDACIKLSEKIKDSPPSEIQKVEEIWKHLGTKRYAEKVNTFDGWKYFPPNAKSENMSSATYQAIYDKSLIDSGGDPQKAHSLFQSYFSDRSTFESFQISGVPFEKMAEKKTEIENQFPNEFKNQVAEIRKLTLKDFKSIANKSNYDIHKITFVRDLGESSCSLGLIVNIKGRPAFLCDESFIPDTLPASFQNQAGEITCSSTASSKKYKFAALLIDSLPESFGEIPSLEESAESLKSGQALTLVIFSQSGIFKHDVSLGPSNLNGEFSVISSDNRLFDYSTNQTVTISGPTSIFEYRSGQAFRIRKGYRPRANMILINPDTGNIVAISSAPTISRLTKSDFSNILNSEILKKFSRKTFFSEVVRSDYIVKFVPLKNLAEAEWMSLDVNKFFSSTEDLRRLMEINLDVIELIQSDFDYNKASSLNAFSAAVLRYRDTLGSSLSDTSRSPRATTAGIYEKNYRQYFTELTQQIKRSLYLVNTNNFYPINLDLLNFNIDLNKHLYDYYIERSKSARDVKSIMSKDQKATYERILRKSIKL